MTIYDNDENVARRAGENDTPMIALRKKRFYLSGTHWYFNTREGTREGPFVSRVQAHEANQDYIREMQGLSELVECH